MAESFDPYYKWLGIAPQEQPANHYRLLGIRLFEPDADVIDAAAFQRIAHVRTYQIGPHSPVSQKILNELAAAKVCLLDPVKKAAYDALLRAQVEPPVTPGPPPVTTTAPPRQSSPGVQTPRKPRASLLPAIVGVAVLVGLVTTLFWNRGSATQVAQTSAAKKAASTEATRGSAVPIAKVESTPPAKPPLVVQAATSGPPAPPPAPSDNPPAPSDNQPAPSDNRPAPSDKQRTPSIVAAPSATPSWPPNAPAPAIAPFDASKAKQHQEAWAKSLGAPMEVTNEFWIDLLKEVRLDQDRLLDKWQREGRSLHADPGTPSFAPLPRIPGEAYDLHVEWTRNKGKGSILVVFPVGSHLCTLAIGGWYDAMSVLSRIDGQERPPAATRQPGKVENGKRYAALIKVRVEGEDAAVEVLLDGEPYLQWKGKQSQLSLPDWSQPPYPDRPAVGGGKADVTYHVAKVRVISPSAALTPGLTAERAKAIKDKPAAKKSPARLLALLKKKLRGRVAYSPKTEQLTLTYDWASKQQLQDFDLKNAKMTFTRGNLVLQAGESIRHVVDFKEVTIAVPVLVAEMRGKLVRTSGGAIVSLGGRNPNSIYLDGGSGGQQAAIVPESQRKGIQPIQVTISENRLSFLYGIGIPSGLGKAVTGFHAGQVELFGGDAGFQYGTLVLSGVMDETWLQSFAEE